MGDHDNGAICHECVKFFLDCSLKLGIKCRRRLIEYQDWRIFENHPRKRNADAAHRIA